MTKSTITRERIQRIIRAIDSEAYDKEEIREWLSSDEIMELSRMALAAMDSEPVAEVLSNRPGNDTSTIDRALPVGTQLYRHAQPAPERDQVRSAHAEWSQATFGNVGPVGPLKHLSKEALEAAEQPGDLSEWADMQFLLWDAQRRAGITDAQITQAMIDKLAVNKQREWPEPKDGEPRLHIKEQPAPVVQKTAHSSVIAEQLANVLSEMKVTDHQRAVISCAVDRLNNVAQLLQLSPSALLVPEILDYQGAKELYSYLMTEEETNATVNGWNACRAAMLQAGNSPAQSDCCPAQNVVVPAQSSIDHGYLPECECSGCKATARICDELSANSPANPDCWCRTCRPVVLNDMRFVVCPDCGNKRCPRANDHRNSCTGSNEPGQEGSAYPDTPREVK